MRQQGSLIIALLLLIFGLVKGLKIEVKASKNPSEFYIEKDKKHFTGEWRVENDKVSFTLNIIQKGNDLSGTYSYVVLPNATRIREGKIIGKVKNDIAEINFQADEYEREKGMAQLSFNNKNLCWVMPQAIAESLQLPVSFELLRVKEKQN